MKLGRFMLGSGVKRARCWPMKLEPEPSGGPTGMKLERREVSKFDCVGPTPPTRSGTKSDSRGVPSFERGYCTTSARSEPGLRTCSTSGIRWLILGVPSSALGREAADGSAYPRAPIKDCAFIWMGAKSLSSMHGTMPVRRGVVAESGRMAPEPTAGMNLDNAELSGLEPPTGMNLDNAGLSGLEPPAGMNLDSAGLSGLEPPAGMNLDNAGLSGLLSGQN